MQVNNKNVIPNQSRFQKGHIVTKETRLKISMALMGRKNGPPSEETRKKIGMAQKGKKRGKNPQHSTFMREWIAKNGHPMKGKKHSEETRNKISRVQIGKILSEETKQKISLANKGNSCGPVGPLSKEHREKISLANKGRTSPMFGKKHTEESKRKMSIAQIGEKLYNWKDGIFYRKSHEHKHLCSKYKSWMFAIKKRDHWKCKIADKKCSGRLEAHHILSWKDYPELRYEVNNGITLCLAHHPRKRAEEKRLSSYFQRLIVLSSS